MTLTEFLLARIAEDETEARDAIQERERVDYVNEPEVPDMGLMSWPDIAVPAVVVGPERVLAECEAKRFLIGQCDPDDFYESRLTGWVLEGMASVYADHPDYQQEWALQTSL